MADDGRRRRLSPGGMIGALVALIAVVVVVIALVSGGGDDSGTPTKAASTAGAKPASPTGRAGTLVLGQFRPATGKIANPYVAASDALVSDGLHELVYEPLFYVNYQSGKSEPWLASGYEYSNANKTITITLRDGVTWNDGKPFTSDDVVYTMRQILKAKAPYRAANIQASVKSVKALSPTSVQIELKASNPRFVDTDLSAYVYTANFIPLPKHVFQGHDFETYSFYDLAKGLPVGTGPYKLTSVGPTSATLTRNADWWAAKTGLHPLPAPQRVVYTTPGPEDTTVSGLETNKLDYAGEAVPSVAGYIAASKQNPKLLNWNKDLGWLDPCPFSMTINTTAKPWDDPAMRWALNQSIDKDQFSKLFNTPGEPTPARTTFPAYPKLDALLDANPGLLEQHPTLDHDLAKAGQVFQSKGYSKHGGVWTKDGKPLTLRLSIFSAAALGPIWTNAAQLLNQQLKAAGIKVDLKPGDFDAIVAARTAGKFDAQTWFECGSVTDPWATLNRYTNAPGNDNAGKWKNAQYDKIVAQMGELTPGDPKIAPLYSQAMAIWLKDLPVIPLNQRPEPIVVNRTYWTGWPSETEKDAYTQPAPWGMNFHQVITHLKPAGGQ
ncbi:MAG: peptide/nickel transport system substrate-binding protein [Solirubrobacteraceae bacterium]